MLNSYWFTFSQSSAFVHNFLFKDIRFGERFNRFINFSARNWVDFSVVISVTSKVVSILPFIFLLRDFLKIPVNNKNLKDKVKRNSFFDQKKSKIYGRRARN
jgi:hypothetical protein